MGIFDSVFGKKDKTYRETKQLPWIPLESVGQLENINLNSASRTQVIFKHSNTCGISSMVLNMFNTSFDLESDCDLYFLSIQSHRDVSNEIAASYGIRHESPQLLVVKNGVVTYHSSHGGIADTDLKSKL